MVQAACSDGLDGYDLKILRALARDGRMSWRDLAETIGLSLTPTLRRVHQLEETGYIRGYAAILNEERLLGPMVVFVSVSLEKHVDSVLQEFEGKVSSIPEVVDGYLTSGDADYLLRVVVRNLEHFKKLLDEITRIKSVSHIQTHFSLKSVLGGRDRILPQGR